MKKRTKALALVLTVLLVGGIIIVKTLGYQTSIRKHLPSGATEIKEEIFGMNDFTRYMKAKCSESDFETFKRSLGYTEENLLTEHDRQNFSWGQVNTDPVDSWWSPTGIIEGSYGRYDESGEFSSMIKYEGGYAYFIAHKW